MVGALASTLRRDAEALGLMLSPGQMTQMQSYLGLVQKWNKVYNLTAIRDPQEMLTHHLLDSLAVVAPLRNRLAGLAYAADGGQDLGSAAKVGADVGVDMGIAGGINSDQTTPFLYRLLDVGAGAGLPGVVIAICCPDIQVTCIDAVAKKMAFVQQVATELRLSNLRARHVRVETVTEPFDIITARAFATLADFVQGSRAALRPQTGIWMAMKAKDTTAERAALAADIGVFHVEPLHVPGLDAERHLVWMRPKAA